ncbi:FimV/HubP family polar landmark protein [Ferrimonas marina]|uniref:Pilus assembly protein FimV n=2 Tax=Ferrimonas marina TaxID=299255 RepID=A0A1M5Y9J7_9GAMM|nr:FimV/HubP family polar landmark protein [Ferrimonas marina]SHI08652.1 pilus assembly protein FimV [Ferrimonas marina]
MNNTMTRALCAAVLGSAMMTLPVSAKTLKITGPDGQIMEVEDAPLATYGPTSRRDTLWRIANDVRPDTGVTVYQVMQALFNANPHAFSSSNFNSLERGKILTVPPREVIAAFPESEARAQARQHDQAWQPPVLDNQGQAKSAPAAAAAPSSAAVSQLEAEKAELQAQLAEQEREQAQISALRQELASTADEMAKMLEQNALLQQQLDELGNEMTVLRRALDEQQGLNRALEEELDRQRSLVVAPDAVVNEPVLEEPSSFWRDLLANPLSLTLWSLLPVGLALLLIFAWLRRRQDQEADAAQAELRDADPVVADEAPMEETLEDGTLEELVMADDSKAGIQLEAELKDDEILSLDQLLEEQRQEAQAASTEVEQAETQPAAVEPEPVAVEPAPMPQAVETPAAPAPADEPFIDIDKLLEESELSQDPADLDSENDTMVAMSEPALDEGGINAKLDLARAYIEIDDNDSAKALLKEVALEGTESQRKEADLLLSQL